MTNSGLPTGDSSVLNGPDWCAFCRDDEDGHCNQHAMILRTRAAEIEAERDKLREAVRPVVEALNAAPRIIGLTDFREVRIEDKTWRPLARLLKIKVRR